MEEKSKTFCILHNEQVGRYITANCELQPGQIIFSEIPFTYGPKSDTPPLCLGCYTSVNGSTLCSKCSWPVCGLECETISAHKDAECSIFSSAGVRFRSVEDYTVSCLQYECITPLRCALEKEKNPERWEREIMNMESHNDLRKNLPIWNFNQVNIVNFIRERCKMQNRFDENLLHKICGILEINAFEGRNVTGYTIRVLYPTLAIMSHSCISNITHSIIPIDEDGKQFRTIVRSSCKVPKGGELFSSYTNSLNPTLLRREHLREGKYFDCCCERCADPTECGTNMSSLKCQKCNPGLITSTNPLDASALWKCSHCEFSSREDTIKHIFISIQNELDIVELTGTDSRGIEEREKVFRKYRSVLHPRHAFMTVLRHSLSQMYGRMEGYLLEDLPDVLLERKVELCRNLLANIDVVEPGYSRLRGMTMYELHAPLIMLARNMFRTCLIDKDGLKTKLEEAKELLEESSKILSLEPPCSPEGIIGQVARRSLEQLCKNFSTLLNNTIE